MGRGGCWVLGFEAIWAPIATVAETRSARDASAVLVVGLSFCGVARFVMDRFAGLPWSFSSLLAQ